MLGLTECSHRLLVVSGFEVTVSGDTAGRAGRLGAVVCRYEQDTVNVADYLCISKHSNASPDGDDIPILVFRIVVRY